MHPNHEHMTRAAEDPDAWLDRRLEVAQQSGVPAAALAAYRESRKGQDFGIAAIVAARPRPAARGRGRDRPRHLAGDRDPGARALARLPLPAREAPPDLRRPPARRISLFYDYGYSPDPAGEFLSSLDAVDELDARLCLPGHGRTFTDVRAHVNGNRDLVNERVSNALAALQGTELTALEVQPHVHGQALDERTGNWWLMETLCYLRHLEETGRARSHGDDPVRWTAVDSEG